MLSNVEAQFVTTINDGAKLTVTDDALFYSGGGWKNVGTVNNAGWIMLVGDNSSKFQLDNNSSFNLKFSDANTYGQLYISGIKQSNISGKVNKEYKIILPQSRTARHQLALPFYQLSIDDLNTILGNYLNLNRTAIAKNGRSSLNSIFVWNNAKARFDQLTKGSFKSGSVSSIDATTSIGDPTSYYIVPRKNSNGSVMWNAPSLKEFKGVPASDEATKNFELVTLDPNYISSFGNSGEKRNVYKEKYSTYLDDPFATRKWRDVNYGKNLSQFGNPFLTNIDLSNITADRISGDTDGVKVNNIYGIAYYDNGSVSWTANAGATYNTSYTKVATVQNGTFQAGDVNSLVIKPMQEVMIKFSSAGKHTINLNNTRLFSQNSRTSSDYSVVAIRQNIEAAQVDAVKQVALILQDTEGSEIYRTYYAVSNSSVTGSSDYATLQSSLEQAPIYTKEEKLDGGEDQNNDYKLYINEANESNYKGKEIPLYVEYASPARLKFELYEGGKQIEDGADLSTGVSFYIKNKDKLTKITSGKSIDISSGKYSLYYDVPEVSLSTGTFDTKGQTIIAKKDNTWVVRFASDWKHAKVEVYSALGQLLNVKNVVDTNVDYELPLQNEARAMYLVKVTSDKGETIVKKIIK